MDRSHRHGALRTKKLNRYPEVRIDRDANFASIKVGLGVEKRSYIQNGVVVCEDRSGHVIEIQLLNLKALLSDRKNLAA